VLTAATELLIELGPQGVTVDAVCERSGVAKSTIYRHWESVVDLLIDVMRSNVPPHVTFDLAHGFERALRSMMREVSRSLSSPQLLRVLPALVSLRLQIPEVADLMRADLDERTLECKAVLDLGVEEGVLPAGLDPHRVMQLLVGPLFFAVLVEKGEELRPLADEVVRSFLESHARAKH
jgi:AcrR family transcriptional regulator